MVTGQKVKELRESLGLDARVFSQLLGVNVSTLYRWESQKTKSLRIEPLQQQILAAVERAVELRGSAEELGAEVSSAVLIRGSLFGLYKVLRVVFADAGL